MALFDDVVEVFDLTDPDPGRVFRVVAFVSIAAVLAPALSTA
jgi:hypothetical protein